MTFGNGSGSVSTDSEFEEALRDLIYEAVIHGVSVEGGWDVSNDDRDDLTDYAIEILRMQN